MMTEAQLAVLLRNYHARLVDAIAETFAALPDEAKNVRHEKVLNPFISAGFENREITEVPALDTLEALADSMKADIDILERASKQVAQSITR